MNLDVNFVELDGSWWGGKVPRLVLKDRFGTGAKKVVIELSPGIIEELVAVLWKAQKSHSEVSDSMKRMLKGE